MPDHVSSGSESKSTKGALSQASLLRTDPKFMTCSLESHRACFDAMPCSTFRIFIEDYPRCEKKISKTQQLHKAVGMVQLPPIVIFMYAGMFLNRLNSTVFKMLWNWRGNITVTFVAANQRSGGTFITKISIKTLSSCALNVRGILATTQPQTWVMLIQLSLTIHTIRHMKDDSLLPGSVNTIAEQFCKITNALLSEMDKKGSRQIVNKPVNTSTLKEKGNK
uniref:Uncharacterized protein n=1 Tax=Glossina pallidipes TaxID=7398 RepID=A0A1A9ZL35_GLOPL